MPKRLRLSCRALFRNYLYQGKKIDQQVHLGYDLSSTQHADLVKRGQSMVRAAPPARWDAITFISACSWEGIQIDPKEWGGMHLDTGPVAKRVSLAWFPHQQGWGLSHSRDSPVVPPSWTELAEVRKDLASSTFFERVLRP